MHAYVIRVVHDHEASSGPETWQLVGRAAEVVAECLGMAVTLAYLPPTHRPENRVATVSELRTILAALRRAHYQRPDHHLWDAILRVEPHVPRRIIAHHGRIAADEAGRATFHRGADVHELPLPAIQEVWVRTPTEQLVCAVAGLYEDLLIEGCDSDFLVGAAVASRLESWGRRHDLRVADVDYAAIGRLVIKLWELQHAQA